MTRRKSSLALFGPACNGGCDSDIPGWPSTEKSPGAPLKSLIINSCKIAYCAALTYNSFGTFQPVSGLSFDFHKVWEEFTGRASKACTIIYLLNSLIGVKLAQVSQGAALATGNRKANLAG